jgi:hypothetical protein
MEAVIIILVVLWLVSGHAGHRAARRRGHRLNYGWSVARGPWIGIRVLGGHYYHNV